MILPLKFTWATLFPVILYTTPTLTSGFKYLEFMLCLMIEPHLISLYNPVTAVSAPIMKGEQCFHDSGFICITEYVFFNTYTRWGNHNSLFSGCKSSNIWVTQWHLVEDIPHLSMLIVLLSRVPFLFLFPFLCYSFLFCLSLLMTRRSASTGPIHQAMTPAESHSLWQTSI